MRIYVAVYEPVLVLTFFRAFGCWQIVSRPALGEILDHNYAEMCISTHQRTSIFSSESIMVRAVSTNPALHRTPQAAESNGIPAQSRANHSVQSGKKHEVHFGENTLSNLKTKSQEGAARLRAGTGELGKLLGQKMKEKVAEQLTPEKIASAALTVGKIAIQSAPALPAGPAAFGAAVMKNGGTELAKNVAEKASKKIADPEVQKKVLTEGIGMAAQILVSSIGGPA